MQGIFVHWDPYSHKWTEASKQGCLKPLSQHHTNIISLYIYVCVYLCVCLCMWVQMPIHNSIFHSPALFRLAIPEHVPQQKQVSLHHGGTTWHIMESIHRTLGWWQQNEKYSWTNQAATSTVLVYTYNPIEIDCAVAITQSFKLEFILLFKVSLGCLLTPRGWSLIIEVSGWFP